MIDVDFDDDDFDLVDCPGGCGLQTEKIRIKMGKLCINCNSGEGAYIGNVEGSSKQGVLNMAKANNKEAVRRLMNGGTAIIRRNTSAKIMMMKGNKSI